MSSYYRAYVGVIVEFSSKKMFVVKNKIGCSKCNIEFTDNFCKKCGNAKEFWFSKPSISFNNSYSIVKHLQNAIDNLDFDFSDHFVDSEYSLIINSNKEEYGFELDCNEDAFAKIPDDKEKIVENFKEFYKDFFKILDMSGFEYKVYYGVYAKVT